MEIVLLAFGVTCAAAIGFTKYYHRDRVNRRLLRRTPRTAIAGFPDDAIARVVGRVRHVDEAPLVAPFSGRACAAYEILTFDAKGHEIGYASHARDFVVEDDTGVALVHVDGGVTILQRRETTPPGEPRTDAGEAVDTHQEGILEAGQLASVCGHGRWEAAIDTADQGGYRQSPTRLVLRSTRRWNLIISGEADRRS